ncbi:MAG: hypothetical protein JWN70_4869 [Planctomycetaceae bacterium]|nr:hypothetical protein [Planctomycetaceae bacterium]
MKKWEYKVHTSRTLGEGAALLDGFGNDGWELIGTQKDHKEHYMFFFKREKVASQPEPE